MKNNNEKDDEEDKFIKENHKEENDNQNKDNKNNINIFKSQNIEFVLTGSKKKKVDCVDEGTNTINKIPEDNTLEIERKINYTFKNANTNSNNRTILGYKGNSFRTGVKDNRFNKKYGTAREKNDRKFILLLDSKNNNNNLIYNEEENKNGNDKDDKEKKEENIYKDNINIDNNNVEENNISNGDKEKNVEKNEKDGGNNIIEKIW